MQSLTIPLLLRIRSAVLTQADSLVRHFEGGSQVSAPSIRPLPHPAQSLSVVALQTFGQNESPPTQVREVTLQEKVHFVASPDLVAM